MITAKLNKTDLAQVSDKIDSETILSYKNETYFIYSDIPKIFFNREAIKNNSKYYMGIKINVIGENIEIFIDKVVIFEVINNIIERVILEQEFDMVQDTASTMKRDMMYALVRIIDYESRPGKEVLLKNFLKVNTTPEWMNNRVEGYPSYNFKRVINCSENSYIDLTKLIGTDHPDYMNKTWSEMYFTLKRDYNIIHALLFPEYYNALQRKEEEKETIDYVKFDGNYYINSGNHRSLLAKMKGLEFIYAPLIEYQTDFEYQEYFNKLKEIGCEVDLPLVENYYEHKSDYGVEENWEVFRVKYNGKYKNLAGIEEIKKFYHEVEAKSMRKKHSIQTYVEKVLSKFQ